jgi:hypothetical protein
VSLAVEICQYQKSVNTVTTIIISWYYLAGPAKESETKSKGKKMKIKTYIRYWLWGIAENMDWKNRPPRKLWKWLLRRYDKYFGYRCEKPEDKPFNYYPTEEPTDICLICGDEKPVSDLHRNCGK